MNKNTFPAMKIVIFIFGLMVIAFCAVIFKGIAENMAAEYIFAVVCVVLIYTAALLPILCGGFEGDISRIAVRSAIYYKGMAAYGAATAEDAIRVMVGRPLGIAIIVECVELFIFLIYIYFACISAKHIKNVEQANAQTLSGVTELRKAAQSLSAEASALGDEYSELKKEIEKINENMRFLSPSTSPEAGELEKMMSALLTDMLHDGLMNGSSTASKDNIEANLKNFDRLYRQRKNIR